MSTERQNHVRRSTNPIAFALLFVAPAALGFQSASSTASGKILGQVVLNSSGSPLAGATVTAYRINPAPTVSAIGVTAANGKFTISGLPAGQFGICVKSSNSSLIDPCQWVDLQTTVNVTSGNTSSVAAIRMRAASALTMRVNDTGQFLSQKATDAAAPHVVAGAFDMKGIFHPALETQKDSTGISYQLNIPYDFPVKMTVYSAKVQLTSAQTGNAAVPAQGFNQIVVQPSAQPQLPVFAFSAVGRN